METLAPIAGMNEDRLVLPQHGEPVNDEELSQYKYFNAQHWYKIAPNFLETVGTNGTSTAKGLLGSAPATWLALLFHPAGWVVNPTPRGRNDCCGHQRGRHAR